MSEETAGTCVANGSVVMHPNAIAALTALAKSDTLDETLPALDRVRSVLGADADAWKPLLEMLTLKAQERAELKRMVRAASRRPSDRP